MTTAIIVTIPASVPPDFQWTVVDFEQASNPELILIGARTP